MGQMNICGWQNCRKVSERLCTKDVLDSFAQKKNDLRDLISKVVDVLFKLSESRSALLWS
jgi:hypothetical protein